MDTMPPNLTGFWRLFEIHRHISQGTYPNCPRLAEMLETSLRTVERDIGRLRDLFGAPIEYDRARNGYFYTEPFELPPMRFREGEAIAIFLGQKLLAQCRGTPFEEFVRQAMAKIRVFLPQSIEVNVEKALEAVSFHVDPLRGEEEEVARRYQSLSAAIDGRKSVYTDYFTASRQTVTHRKIDPYHLRLVGGAWYCIGYCHERCEIRTFAVDRMTALQVSEEPFEAPADFSVDEYLESAWSIERGEPRKVVIEFDGGQAPYIRGRRWHHSQVLEELPDRQLRMTITVGGMGEVMRWVMSLGSHAWVREPEDLKARIEWELRAALEKYASSDGRSRPAQLGLFDGIPRLGNVE
ncbi:MAG TPA: WYL domain-containing transcriptional regulator [Firmicutes bacterium]|nr:WYL domain-containing transcriptional regulator [Candidatus Fermentithermobacillaceae bacterium]